MHGCFSGYLEMCKQHLIQRARVLTFLPCGSQIFGQNARIKFLADWRKVARCENLAKAG